METTPEYQTVIPGQKKTKMRSIRFTPQRYQQVIDFGKEFNWVFSKVVGEAIDWYLMLAPLLQEAEKKSTLLAGKPLIVGNIKDYLMELNAQLDAALIEADILQAEEEYTKE